MQQIADWLKKLGMSEYAERFAANRIDLSVLPDLTDQDLEKLGVFLGDRRKMLRAIVNLEASEKSAPAVPAMVNTAPPTPVVSMPISAAAPPPISAVAEATGERRYLTSDTPHTWVEWSCSQLLQNTPLHPVADWGRQRFGGADVPASSASLSWKARWRRSSSTRPRMLRCWRRCSTFRCRKSAPWRWRQRNCAAGNWQR